MECNLSLCLAGLVWMRPPEVDCSGEEECWAGGSECYLAEAKCLTAGQKGRSQEEGGLVGAKFGHLEGHVRSYREGGYCLVEADEDASDWCDLVCSRGADEGVQGWSTSRVGLWLWDWGLAWSGVRPGKIRTF